MKCKKCRKTIPDGSKFCNHCGTPVEKTKFTRRADGRYVQKVTVNGASKYLYAKTEKELLEKLISFNAAVEIGKSFAEVAEEWEEETEPEVAYNTWKGYKPKMERAVGCFGKKPIRSITAPDIDRYIKQFPKTWAFKTQNGYLSVLSLIFAHAQRRGYITYNPTSAAKLPHGLKRNIRRPPTDAETNIINHSLDVEGGLLAFFFLNTGLRRGEACGLKFGDLDFKTGILTVKRSVYWAPNQPEVKTPKTKAGKREVFVPDELNDCLKKLKRRRKATNNDIVFCDADNGIYSNKRFAKMWETYQEKTGLTNITPHMLRHGYASMLKKANVDPMIAQKLLGHAQYSTTADIYTHIGENYAAQAKSIVEIYTNRQKSCQTSVSPDK